MRIDIHRRIRIRRSGFTLPEVLVTVTVVAVLAAVVVPAVTQYASKGDVPATKEAINAVNTAIASFVADNRTFPVRFTDMAKYAGGLSFGSTANSSTATFPGYASMVLGNVLDPADRYVNGVPYVTADINGSSKSCGDIDAAIDDGIASTGFFQYGGSSTAIPCIGGFLLLVPRTT
jgi:prepilin-type N-terminal cleavage/methylation domain-containing protein